MQVVSQTLFEPKINFNVAKLLQIIMLYSSLVSCYHIFKDFSVYDKVWYVILI